MRQRLPGLLLILLLLALAMPGAVRAEDPPVLLVQSSSGTYGLDGEDLLIIEGISGTLSLRASPNDSLQFEGRRLNSQRELQEVALWRAGDDTLLLGPGAEVAEEGTLVDMMVPDGMDVEVVVVGGRVLVATITGDLVVEAENSRVRAKGLRGGAEFLLAGGILVVDGVKGPFSVEGTEVKADIQHLYGYVELNLEQGRATITGSEGDVQIESEQTDIALTKVRGTVRVESTGGSVSISECSNGGDLQLEETTLSLLNSKGEFSVRTNAMLEFGQLEGLLRVVGFGAPIQGSQFAGPLFVENDSSTVDLKQLSGSAEIRGNELKLTVDGCKGPLHAQVVSSEVSINAASGETLVENDFGDIRTTATEGTLKITSSGGNVHVSNHQGALELRAEGPEVHVDWVKFNKNEMMSVMNKRGDIYLGLPSTGRCNLQIKAPFGRVDTELSGIEVADDGKTASGEFTGGRGRAPQVKKPLLKIESGGGNVYIGASSQKE